MEPEDIVIMEIKGQVKLNDGSQPDQVYVWFEKINQGLYTDQDGNFVFSINSSMFVGNEYKLNGSVKLYFYLGNYALDSCYLDFADGKLLENYYFQQDGTMKSTKYLKKLLNIETTVSDTVFKAGIGQILEIIVNIEAVYEPVDFWIMARFLRPSEPIYYSLIFQPEPFSLNDILIHDVQSAQPYRVTVDMNNPFLSIYYLASDTLNFKQGQYRIFPFILIDRNVPDQILQEVGYHLPSYYKDFHILPMKRDDAFIQFEE